LLAEVAGLGLAIPGDYSEHGIKRACR
jgi:hypothetical protein